MPSFYTIIGMYTVDFKKKGLPHAYILMWLNWTNKLENASDIDKILFVELPHPNMYSQLSEAVSKYIVYVELIGSTHLARDKVDVRNLSNKIQIVKHY